MHQLPYRLKVLLIMAGISLISCSALFTACKKDPALVPPVLSFIHDEGYTSNDTMIDAGQKIKIGILCSTTNANLTYLSVHFNNGTNQILLDSGMNTPSLVYTLDVIKTNDPIETWTFLVMDRNRIQDSVQITLIKSDSSKWGKIRILKDVCLGSQENGTTGSFFSLDENNAMTLSQAYGAQPSVDLIYYYGQYEGTLSSPNEAEAPGFFTGPQGIANWTVKNETRYDTTGITSQAFDLSQNDSLILAAYEPAAGKKKGKFLQPEMVLSFRSHNGKLGLIKVQEITPFPAGQVKFSIKIQE